jgi:uncharacterized phage infection (PIP) family protein YhgE
MPENANPLRSHLNQYIVQHDHNIGKTIDKRIEEGYTGETAIRKDAVKAVSIVLTGTHERMIELEKTGRLGEWVQSNQEWLNTRYGKENVVSLALHMDELTPHLHAVIVPLTVQGRLSAKLILGQKVQMREMQTDYARAMKPFGLERGKEGSRAHHEDVKEYYKRLKEDLPKVTEEVEVKKEEVKELKQEIPRLNVVINKQEEELEKLKKAESKLKIKLAEIRANLAGFTLLKGFKYITEGIHALWTRKAKFEALNRENSTLNQKYDETYNELVKVAQASKMVIGDLQKENAKLLNKNGQLERENKDLNSMIKQYANKLDGLTKEFKTIQEEAMIKTVKFIKNWMLLDNLPTYYDYDTKEKKMIKVNVAEERKREAEQAEKAKITQQPRAPEVHIPTVDEIRGTNKKQDKGFHM